MPTSAGRVDEDAVSLAAKTLGPILRKRGTSPALGASLRRAVHALDKALIGDDGVLAEAVHEAASELRSCVAIIGTSERPADHEQLAAITRVLSILVPPLAEPAPLPTEPMRPTAVPISSPLPVAAVQPAPEPVLLPTRQPQIATLPSDPSPAPVPEVPASLAFPTVQLRLVILEDHLRVFHVALAKPLTALRDLRYAEAGLRAVVEAIRWLGPKRIAAFRRAADDAGTDGSRLAADLALAVLGKPNGVAELLGRLARASAAERGLPLAAGVALRILDQPEDDEAFLKFFGRTSRDEIRALLLPILSERQLVSSDELLELVRHSSDALALAAIDAVAWSGGARDASIVLDEALCAPSAARSNALLCAAVALGSSAALDEARRRLSRKPTEAPRRLVEALAIGGGASDTGLILEAADAPGADVAHAVLAAANLGCVTVLPKLASFASRLSTDILTTARRMLVGESPSPDRDQGTARLLGGREWSVAGVLLRLEARDEPVRSRQRLALELCARTGIRPPGVFPLLVSRTVSPKIIGAWRQQFAKADARLKPGEWYFRGRPLTPQAKEGVET
jgi:hypothetical protein